MHGVGAGLDSDVDDRAGLPAIFGTRIFFGLEFVDGVDGNEGSRIAGAHNRANNRLRHPGIAAVHAFEQVHVVMRALPIGALRPPRPSGIHRDSGAQLQQVGEVAAVHGQVRDDFALQSSAKLCVAGFHHRQRFGDDNPLGLLARLQRQIDAQVLIDLENDAGAFLSLEAPKYRPDSIGTWEKVGSIVFACAVRS